MSTQDQPYPLTHAVLTQVKAEMAAADYSVASLARALDEDRNTLRRWISGEREMPVVVLIAIIEQLNLDPAVFMARARERLR